MEIDEITQLIIGAAIEVHRALPVLKDGIKRRVLNY
jgi:hypothetical protein